MIALRVAQQDPPAVVQAPVVWLAQGFRPFFLLASLWGWVLMAAWVPLFLGRYTLPLALTPILWHAHEMFFGFVAAVIAGFLLTAVPNWTGQPTPRGLPLGGLALLWLSGRCLTTLGGPALAWPWVLLDLAFLPALGLALATPLIRAKQPKNLVFLPLLAVLTAANGMIWWGGLQAQPVISQRGLALALYSILLIIVIIGGRVIPFFTSRAVPGSQARHWPWLEKLCWSSILLVACLEVSGVGGRVGATVCVLAALVHARRLTGWWTPGISRIPLLWILYAGYACLPLGLALKAAAQLGLASPSAALHMFTAGCMGCMILGMMARVALGHSGRELRSNLLMSASFALMVSAAMVRSLLPILWPAQYINALWTAGALWVLALLWYFLHYLPILVQPRQDGKPG